MDRAPSIPSTQVCSNYLPGQPLVEVEVIILSFGCLVTCIVNSNQKCFYFPVSGPYRLHFLGPEGRGADRRGGGEGLPDRQGRARTQ